MSRHEIEGLVVGWDQPMQTYFAQRLRDGVCTLGIGTHVEELYDLDAFKRALRTELGFTLPADLEAELYVDRDLGR